MRDSLLEQSGSSDHHLSQSVGCRLNYSASTAIQHQFLGFSSHEESQNLFVLHNVSVIMGFTVTLLECTIYRYIWLYLGG